MNFYEAAKFMDTGREFIIGEVNYKFSCNKLFRRFIGKEWCRNTINLINLEDAEFELIPEKQYTFQEAAELALKGDIFKNGNIILFSEGKVLRKRLSDRGEELPSCINVRDIKSMWIEVT